MCKYLLNYSRNITVTFSYKWRQEIDIKKKTQTQYITIQYNTLQYYKIQYSTIQCSTAQYNTIQYSTLHYSRTVLVNTIYTSITVFIKFISFTKLHCDGKSILFIIKASRIYCLFFHYCIMQPRVYAID